MYRKAVNHPTLTTLPKDTPYGPSLLRFSAMAKGTRPGQGEVEASGSWLRHVSVPLGLGNTWCYPR